MNLDTVSDRNLHEIERVSEELIDTLRQAKLLDLPIVQMLRNLETQAEETRRRRFDEINPEFRGY
jgi:hypothetical protein